MQPTTYPIIKHRWRVADPLRPGRRYETRHHMTEADALERDPGATPVEGTRMVITGPSTPHGSPDLGLPKR